MRLAEIVDDFFTRMGAQNAQRRVRAGELAKLIDQDGRITITNRSGHQIGLTRTTRAGYAWLARSAVSPKAKQATTFEGGEPVGHVLFATTADAAAWLAREVV
jgi:hypothetical protein